MSIDSALGQNFAAGAYQTPKGAKLQDVMNPDDQSSVGRTALCGSVQIDDALNAAALT